MDDTNLCAIPSLLGHSPERHHLPPSSSFHSPFSGMSDMEDGDKIRIIRTPNDDAEAERIANEILHQHLNLSKSVPQNQHKQIVLPLFHILHPHNFLLFEELISFTYCVFSIYLTV